MYKKNVTLDTKDVNCLSFCFINNTNILVYKNKNKKSFFYIPFPNFILLKKNGQVITLVGDLAARKEIDSFSFLLLRFIKSPNKNFAKILILRGLGFRLNLNTNILQLKLGFSHLVNILVPINKITALVKKKSLYLTGPNLALIGNFAQKIKSLKTPNTYTGKGFKFKNQKLFTKVFKKK